jgi:hypothetical protein
MSADEGGDRVYLYRVVTSKQPTLEDFASNAALDRAPQQPLGYRQQRLWEGLSVFDTLDAARALAMDSPRKGGFVAVLALPDGIQLKQSGRNPHHYTLWLPAETLHAAVETVLPVQD